jgi:hypothetical protein
VHADDGILLSLQPTERVRGCSHAGESNLKIRRPVDIHADIPNSAVEAHCLLGILSCEQPNPDLHTFIGNFTYCPSSGAARINSFELGTSTARDEDS